MKKVLVSTLLVLVVCINSNAQSEPNPITTAAPFLLIAPDARAGGMGDMGVASTPDSYSQHWNASKFAFMPSQFSLGIYYTPWLRELTNDVFLGGVSFANRINDRSAWAATLNYFNIGEIELTDDSGNFINFEKLNEFYLDGSYSIKLSDVYSMGVSLRYIRSDLGIKSTDTSINPVNTVAVDVSGYYQSDEKNHGNFNGQWKAGFNVSNIGPKVSYTPDGQDDYIPTNLKFGGGYNFIFDGKNELDVLLEFNKLLVPTPSISVNDDGEPPYVQEDVPFFSGMFISFADAPNGMSEEMKEFTWAIGGEYVFDDAFAFRVGYFNENELKGARKYFTIGTGFKFKSSRIDISYLFNTSEIKNPLENTFRFSLSFDFGSAFGAN